MIRSPVDLLWLPLNVLQFVVAVAWSIANIVVALVIRVVTGNTRLALGMARFPWSYGMMAIGGYSFEVHGADEIDWSKPYFLASNHQSFLDIVLLFRALPINLHFVVKQELAKVPFLAWYIRAMGMIFVDRGNRARAQRSVQRTAELVAGGKSVLLFPEGTRSPDGEVHRLKSGVLAAAAAGSVPVIPIAVDGPHELMPPNVFRVRPGRLKVSLGAPIDTAQFSSDDRRELADLVQQRIAELLAGLRATPEAEPGP